ncbi:hypothetical protein DM860_002253 [Cuscuta australis]|uniref:BAH domain-containing protein n=1 Tax=Cuscuta australis TaxID=267555 RepID=A0A328CXT3_9ASTE|nr:hypothetical protein DM860_002253 [Cuscuta australis]
MATAEKAPLYVSWNEVSSSADKGRKEVCYYLNRRDGVSDLVVVGTEKGIKHFSYHYALKDPSLLSASYPVSLPKLRKRREVIDWLNSIVSGLNYQQNIKELSGFRKNGDACPNALNTLEDGHLQTLGQHATDFTWIGSPWTCRKKRCHYTSFCRNGVRISVYDFVFILAEEGKRLVAYLDDMFEDIRGNRKVVVRWFHKIDEVGILLHSNYNDREILFSLCHQSLGIECVDGLATVLSPQHYQSFINLPSRTHPEPFVCHRLFDNNELKPFVISDVNGYWNQELLKQMRFSLPHKTKPEESPIGFSGNRPNQRLCLSKYSEPRKELVNSFQEQCNTSSLRAAVTCTFQEACFEGSSLRDVVRENHLQFFDIGSQVEIISQDSGIRGCWFRALVIKKHKNKVKVQYKDVKDADDEAKNLEEWVLETKLAAPDKLGLRMHGRTILRPSPSSHKGRVSWVFNVGESVDAWWNEGWWEGIVVHKESENRLLVNFPGEKRTEIFSHTDLRHSQEWLMDGWKHLKDRPDLVPLLLGGEPAVKETMKASHDGTLANGNISNSVCTRSEKPKELRVKVVFSKNTNLDAMMERACDDLSKDDRLGQLKWKSNKKRRLCRSPPAANKAHFCSVNLPSSIKVEPEKCKYITDSLFKSSAVSPLNNLVMSQ